MSISPDTSLPPGLSPLESGDPPVIGPYRVVGRIGEGGMGAVYGALDVYGSCVAVKTVHAHIAREPRFREAFAREVQMLGRADGVSTARLHAADTRAEVPWLAFDYVAGRDLRAHVQAFGPLEGDMLRTFSLGMAEGLAALHAAGIAHRDIKPGNVILSPDGPKIVDFGIAVEIGTERAMDASASYGTPGWTAPERYSGAAADPSADVFAWGGLVTLAATGRQPFGKGEAKELARRVKEGEYGIDGVPEDLLGLVRAALSVDPKQRPSSQTLVRALMPVPAEETQNQSGRPQTAADSLRGMLRDYWRGVDDAGHDPGRWAAALGVASAAGLGASALGSGVVGVGAMGAGGAAGSGAATGAGAGAVTAGGGTAAAGSGAVTAGGSATSTATGGMMSGIATSKLGLAGAGLLAVAGLTAGGFVVYDQVSDNPSETVAAAAGILEESEGFTAQVTRSFSQAHAEQVAERTGASVEQVMEDSLVEEEYLYSAADQTFLIRGAAMGPGTTAVANHRGDLYVYASREEAPRLWENSPQQLSVVSAGVSISFGEEGDHGMWKRSPEPLEYSSDLDTDSVAATLITAPLRTLSEADGIEAVEGQERVYTGSIVLELLDGGALVSEEGTGQVGLDGEGTPVWAEYTTDLWEVRVDFEAVGAEAPMEDPQVWAAENDGFGWTVVHAPICGTVGLPDWVPSWDEGRMWDVQASGWDVDCDYAMDVAELREDFGRGPDRQESLHAFRGTMSNIAQFDDTMACGLFWNNRRGADPLNIEHAYAYGPCQEATVLSVDDSEELYKDSEVEFGPVTLIDFHEQS
ncbi:serine/threonine-protein kinase [Nocardiopsis valliformis]|uniref:serine/threonine-protein kinase n=1 Tax=Nocardiopsis valliformis TaxID=239974 RepID=UPI00034D6DBA|nr:serine/threonine-protein kinase [Nocardiopsis valliformis]